MCTAKSKNLLFAGSVSKKGQAELAFFGVKNATHYPSARVVGAHCVRPYDNPKTALV
jgi:hypothetical protein